MMYVNASANDFKGRNIWSLVSPGPTHYVTGSMDLTQGPLKSMEMDWKNKTQEKRTLSQALFIFPLTLQACNLRDHIYSPHLGGTNGADPARCFARDSVRDANHGDLSRQCECSSNLSIQRGKKNLQPEKPLHSVVVALCMALKCESHSILHPATPQPALWVPTEEINLPENKAGSHSYSLCYLQALLQASIPNNLGIFFFLNY